MNFHRSKTNSSKICQIVFRSPLDPPTHPQLSSTFYPQNHFSSTLVPKFLSKKPFQAFTAERQTRQMQNNNRNFLLLSFFPSRIILRKLNVFRAILSPNPFNPAFVSRKSKSWPVLDVRPSWVCFRVSGFSIHLPHLTLFFVFAGTFDDFSGFGSQWENTALIQLGRQGA